MTFTTIISEGNLIPADLLEQIALGEAAGQRPDGVEKALLALGNGLLQHPANAALRAKFATDHGQGDKETRRCIFPSCEYPAFTHQTSCKFIAGSGQ